MWAFRYVSSSTRSQGNEPYAFNTKLAWFTEEAVKWLLEKAAYPSLISDMVSLSSFQLCQHDSKYQQSLTPNFVFEITDSHFLCTESLE